MLKNPGCGHLRSFAFFVVSLPWITFQGNLGIAENITQHM